MNPRHERSATVTRFDRHGNSGRMYLSMCRNGGRSGSSLLPGVLASSAAPPSCDNPNSSYRPPPNPPPPPPSPPLFLQSTPNPKKLAFDHVPQLSTFIINQKQENCISIHALARTSTGNQRKLTHKHNIPLHTTKKTYRDV